jgi:hypothetical protein
MTDASSITRLLNPKLSLFAHFLRYRSPQSRMEDKAFQVRFAGMADKATIRASLQVLRYQAIQEGE